MTGQPSDDELAQRMTELTDTPQERKARDKAVEKVRDAVQDQQGKK
jgi:hypothetical protein